MRNQISILCCGLLLCSCAARTPKEPEIEVGTGASIEARSSSSRESFASSVSSKVETNTIEPTLSEAETLQLVYDDAYTVYAVATDAMKQFTSDAQVRIGEALSIFKEDIDALKTYVDAAAKEPLTEEQKVDVLHVMDRVEEGISVFAEMIDMLGQ